MVDVQEVDVEPLLGHAPVELQPPPELLGLLSSQEIALSIGVDPPDDFYVPLLEASEAEPLGEELLSLPQLAHEHLLDLLGVLDEVLLPLHPPLDQVGDFLDSHVLAGDVGLDSFLPTAGAGEIVAGE